MLSGFLDMRLHKQSLELSSVGLSLPLDAPVRKFLSGFTDNGTGTQSNGWNMSLEEPHPGQRQSSGNCSNLIFVG